MRLLRLWSGMAAATFGVLSSASSRREGERRRLAPQRCCCCGGGGCSKDSDSKVEAAATTAASATGNGGDKGGGVSSADVVWSHRQIDQSVLLDERFIHTHRCVACSCVGFACESWRTYQWCWLHSLAQRGGFAPRPALLVSTDARGVYMLCRLQLGSGDETKDGLHIRAIAAGEELPPEGAIRHDAAPLIHGRYVSASQIEGLHRAQKLRQNCVRLVCKRKQTCAHDRKVDNKQTHSWLSDSAIVVHLAPLLVKFR